jgi:hypothetical protein
MELGKPWRRTMPSKKALATEMAVYGWLKAIKWAYFEKRSTTVKITLLPWTLGNPSTKSSEMSSHTRKGTSSGWSKPAGWRASVLFL